MANRKGLATLLFALTNYSLFAQNRHYQGNGFGFDYPPEWKIYEPAITRQSFEADRSQEKYDLVPLYGPGENLANIYLFYRKFPPGKMSGSVSQHIEGLFREELKTSYMNEHDSLESFPAGQAVTVKSDHSIRNPGAEQIATTVCGSEGDVAHVVFAYNADPKPEGRNVILNSLRFAGNPRPYRGLERSGQRTHLAAGRARGDLFPKQASKRWHLPHLERPNRLLMEDNHVDSNASQMDLQLFVIGQPTPHELRSWWIESLYPVTRRRSAAPPTTMRRSSNAKIRTPATSLCQLLSSK